MGARFSGESKADVVIVAGPRVQPWPSVGVRSLKSLFDEVGISYLVIGGGRQWKPRGVLPLPAFGGLVFAEDENGRTHRIRTKSVVRWSAFSSFSSSWYGPESFPGWTSPCVIPLSTAERLQDEEEFQWGDKILLLGTSNRSFRFGSRILEAGVRKVWCVEPYPLSTPKGYRGWEVEYRRFLLNGGQVIGGQPLSLKEIHPQLWRLHLKNISGGNTHLDIHRLLVAGPFSDFPAVKEHPPGSLLFEIEQTASDTRSFDVEGWQLEEQRCLFLAGKIAKSILPDTGASKDLIERAIKKAKYRLKTERAHLTDPFVTEYDGKWLSKKTKEKIISYSGTPKFQQSKKMVASVECFEDISCSICQTSCPESAIKIDFKAGKRELILQEVDCTGCGACLEVCPSKSIVMLKDNDETNRAEIVLVSRTIHGWHEKDSIQLISRKGEELGIGRILKVENTKEVDQDEMKRPVLEQTVTLDIPAHLLWEVRGIRSLKKQSVTEDEAEVLGVINEEERFSKKIPTLIDGEKRFVREGVLLTVALFDIGRNRPSESMYCRDGSCGMCSAEVDGKRRLACQTLIRKNSVIQLEKKRQFEISPNLSDIEIGYDGEELLCPCSRITKREVVERIHKGRLHSPEAVLSVTHVGKGKCHGMLCLGAFKRLLSEEGIDSKTWIDWGFPWADWVIEKRD